MEGYPEDIRQEKGRCHMEVMLKGRRDHLGSLGELGLYHEKFWRYDHSGQRAHIRKSGGEFFPHQKSFLCSI